MAPWTQAEKDGLSCPKCQALNRPGLRVPHIEVTETGACFCAVCAFAWWPRR